MTALARGRASASTLDHVGIFADGVAVKRGRRAHLRALPPRARRLLTVSTDEICAAIKDVFEDTRSVLEPAGRARARGLEARVARAARSPAAPLVGSRRART